MPDPTIMRDLLRRHTGCTHESLRVRWTREAGGDGWAAQHDPDGPMFVTVRIDDTSPTERGSFAFHWLSGRLIHYAGHSRYSMHITDEQYAQLASERTDART